MTRIASWLAVLYVALLPLGRSGLPLNAQWGDALLPLLLAIAVAGGSPRSRWFRAEDWPLALYLFVTFGTAMISAEPLAGLGQLAKQLSVVLILVVFRQLGVDPGLTRLLAKTFVVSVASVTLASILLVFLRVPSRFSPTWLGSMDVLPFFGMVRRLRGGFLTPEMLGNALLVAFVLALALRAGRKDGARVLWTTVAAVLAAGEFLTFSHSAAGFAVSAVVFSFGLFPSRVVRALAWGVAISVVVVVNAASLVEPGPPSNDHGVGPVSLQLIGVQVQGELNHYAALKQVAWSAFLDHPLTGVGPGRFAVETERAFQEGGLTARYRNKPAQCDLAGRLAESGILGGLSLLLLWAAWLRLGRSHPPRSVMQRAAFAAVAGLLVNSLNADVMNFRFLWLAVAWTSSPIEDAAPGRSTLPLSGPTKRSRVPAA